ncbi:DNA polymerase III subunit delta [Alteromonas oceanisediminis]|uniref:DNA polymerase III subunit delta n=1 Tax=Alteromonas oceanisediminis TaxID=2836180 RepID=UPI001BDB0A03|nr:DNA polymerase III subunit delta [Alteromonas oceanisediminis]MBT0586528.1 DNA polymerase III subunit delta [Alteromonas oceanisediminis]
MQVYPNKFAEQIGRQLPKVVLIFGDEPQQKLECIDTLRLAAKQQGFDERQSLVADSEFEWHTLLEAAQSLSLFSAQQFIELELPTAKPGAAGSKALIEVAQSDMTDMLLMVHGPKAGKDVQSTKWFKTLASRGHFTLCYPLEGNRLHQWVQQCLRQHNLSADPEAVALLADSCEGNMLAARQEIEKLALLFNETHLSRENIESAIVDQSRFTVFHLVDVLLQGDSQRAVKMLYRLESEGVEPNIIIWALVREWQTLWALTEHQRMNPAQPLPWQKLRIWGNRQAFYQSALQRLTAHDLVQIQAKLTEADRRFKQSQVSKPYVTLCHLCLLFVAAPLHDMAI